MRTPKVGQELNPPPLLNPDPPPTGANCAPTLSHFSPYSFLQPGSANWYPISRIFSKMIWRIFCAGHFSQVYSRDQWFFVRHENISFGYLETISCLTDVKPLISLSSFGCK